MLKNRVFATIITYNPDKKLLEKNILSIKKQVEKLVLIDNKSESSILKDIQELKKKMNFNLLLNPNNIGVAAALNQALKLAEEGKYLYFLTMDQDTILSEDAVTVMIEELEEHKLSSIGPSFNAIASDTSPRSVNFLITSGNLTRTSVAIDAKGFDEWLFIDCVDTDFSLKLRVLGYKIAQSQKATMLHSFGKKERGIFNILYIEYSPLRHYYMERNRLYIQKKYKFFFPFYCFKLNIAAILKRFKLLFFYKGKYEIFSSMRQGVIDARKHIIEQQ